MLKIQTFKPENSYIKALIYGPSGAGKTTFAATAPKPIFASSEKGLMSIRHLAPQFAEINSLQDLKDLYSFLKNEKHEFETVVIDSITEINDIIKTEIETRNKRNMQLQDWGILQKEIKDILRKFRDLPMHIIFLAQETTEKDEEKIVKYLPSLNGKSATEIAYYMDTVGYCFIDKLGNRKIGTMPNEKYLTKDRTNVIDGGENQNFSEWVEAMKKGIAVTPTTPEKTDEKTEEKSAEETTKASEDTEPKMATEYQISTLVGMIKKLAGEIPYAEQKNKYRATIAAICSRDVWAEGLEEMSAVLTLQEAAKVIGYLKTKIS